MASLVQDVWLGFGPRLRARRLGPWEEPAVRLVFCPGRETTLDDPALGAFLERMSERVEVIAWEPPGQGGSDGRPGPETLEYARRLASEAPGRFGEDPVLVLGGHGLGGWVALAAADGPGVAGAFALDPSFGPDDALTTSLADTLDRPPLAVPTLVLEARDRPAGEARAAAEWTAREPGASRGEVAGGSVLGPPWADVVMAWVESVGAASGRSS